MNPAFAAYTPRVKPTNYDALSLKAGCVADTGNDFFGVRAFDQVCVAPHDEDSEVFNRLDTVSYSRGPSTKGDPTKPFLASWAAWVATQGIRVGKFQTVVPPANGDGDASALWPTTTPTRLTHAWDALGLLHIAIQQTATTIKVRYYTDDEGNIQEWNWSGKYPAAVYSGLVDKGDAPSGSIAIYYLRPERPYVVYARFSAEGYANERVVMPELHIALARLIGAEALADGRIALYAVDTPGRDVTLYSPVYKVTAADAVGLDVNLDGGLVFGAAVFAPVTTEGATLDITLDSGLVFDATVAASEPADGATLEIGFESGEVSTA